MAAYKVEQLQAEAAAVEPRLTAMKGELGQVDVQLAERQREIDDSYGKVAQGQGRRWRRSAQLVSQ